MNIVEKIFSILALLTGAGIVAALLFIPELRRPEQLILLCGAGILVNAGLLFIVLKDIFSRPFQDSRTKFLWLGLILFFWPSIPVYLYRHGFSPRSVTVAGPTQ